MRRTRSEKISAPPPGMESMPAVFQPFQRFANRNLWRAARGTPISTIVNAFRCTCGKRSFRPRSIWQNQSSVSSGCSPPTMWNSVTASAYPRPAVSHTCSSDIV